MSYVTNNNLKAFVKENSWITADPVDEGIAEIISQIDSIIFNKTRVPIPGDKETAPGILRNHACALVVYYTSGKQGELEDSERLRRKALFENAMKYLNDVEAGNTFVLDDDGNVVSTSKAAAAKFTSTKRITGIL